MRLSQPILLQASDGENSSLVDSLVDILRTTWRATRLSRLYFGHVPDDEAVPWLRHRASSNIKSCTVSNPANGAVSDADTEAHWMGILEDEDATAKHDKSNGTRHLVVGFAVWSRSPPGWQDAEMKPQQAEENPNPNRTRPPKDTHNGEFGAQVRGAMAKLRKVMAGKAHYILEDLGTLESYRRKGVGTALMRPMMDAADAQNLPIFLCASELGYSVYLRAGFEVVDEAEIDLARFGGEGAYSYQAMIRQPGHGIK